MELQRQHAVLGMIVEKISGESLEAYFQQHIFEPLGMVDTSYAVPLAKQSRVPTQYNRINGVLAGTAAGAHPVDADGPVPRRWRPLLDRAGLRQVHADDAQRRPPGARENPERELGEDDGREQHRVDLRGVAAGRRQIASPNRFRSAPATINSASVFRSRPATRSTQSSAARAA